MKFYEILWNSMNLDNQIYVLMFDLLYYYCIDVAL